MFLMWVDFFFVQNDHLNQGVTVAAYELKLNINGLISEISPLK